MEQRVLEFFTFPRSLEQSKNQFVQQRGVRTPPHRGDDQGLPAGSALQLERLQAALRVLLAPLPPMQVQIPGGMRFMLGTSCATD
jgi:hypothetical protein